MIGGFDALVAERRVQIRARRIGILCVGFSAVVVRLAFSYLDADRSL